MPLPPSACVLCWTHRVFRCLSSGDLEVNDSINLVLLIFFSYAVSCPFMPVYATVLRLHSQPSLRQDLNSEVISAEYTFAKEIVGS